MDDLRIDNNESRPAEDGRGIEGYPGGGNTFGAVRKQREAEAAAAREAEARRRAQQYEEYSRPLEEDDSVYRRPVYEREEKAYEPRVRTYSNGSSENKKEKKVKMVTKRGFIASIIAVGAACAVGASALTGFLIMPAMMDNMKTEAAPAQQNVTAEAETITPAEAPQLVAYENPVEGVAEYAIDGVVGINTYSQALQPGQEASLTPLGYGSGWVISQDGYIVTNYHVIENADVIKVTTSDGTEYDAVIQGKDYSSDIAVLDIDATGMHALAIGDSDDCKVGEQVIAIGNPIGDQLAGTVTVGYISSLSREIKANGRTYNVLQTDAAINPGNSGGPLFNTQGEVIGMNTLKSLYAGYTQQGTTISSEGIGFAIPIDYVKQIVDELIANGSVLKPGVGIQYYAMSEDDAAAWNMPQGLLVISTVEGGPAYLEGIKENDIITKVDGQDVNHEDFELASYIGDKNVGDSVSLTVYRANKGEFEVTIDLVNINALD